MIALALAVLGCLGEPAPAPGPLLSLEGVRLVLASGVQLEARAATLDESGAGAAAGVHARTGQEPEPLEITAERSEWDLKARTLRFEGEVVAVRGPVRLLCRELAVTYASAERMDRAVATGDVRVERGARSVQGDRAELDVESGRVVLSGHAVLTDGPNRMEGARIVLWLDEERVECESCRLVVEGAAVAPGAP